MPSVSRLNRELPESSHVLHCLGMCSSSLVFYLLMKYKILCVLFLDRMSCQLQVDYYISAILELA